MLDQGHLKEIADLSTLVSGGCNDMVVDHQARAYIGYTGFDSKTSRPVPPAGIILVMPNGEACVVATISPSNGIVITPDGRTLVIAESSGCCLTAFDVLSDGRLTGRRVWVSTVPADPDGICLDAEGAIWMGLTHDQEVLHIREGGQVDQRISLPRPAFACMLGGSARRTLFILSAETFFPDEARARLSGRIEFMEVDVPGVGLP